MKSVEQENSEFPLVVQNCSVVYVSFFPT